MKKKWTIYIHKCKTTGKCYVGQTCRKLETRWGKNGRNYTEHNNLKFYRAIQKYGWEDFEHFIVAQCDSLKKAYDLERYYINELDTFKNGYNSTLGGAGSKGKIVSQEMREKLSKIHKGRTIWKPYVEHTPMKGRHHTKATKKKIGKANRGRVISKEGREKMRLAKLGKKVGPMSEETKRKISIAHTGKPSPMKGKHIKHPHSVKVLQFDINGNFINEYNSIHEAEQETGAKQIARSIKLKNKAGGYIWKRKN